MSALALVLTLLSAAPSPSGPEVGVLVVRRTVVTAADGVALAQQVTDVLAGLGAPPMMPAAEMVRQLNTLGVRDSADCLGRKACTLVNAANLKLQAVIAISVGELDGEQAVELEAFSVPSGALISRESLFLSKKAPLTPALLRKFADNFKAGYAPSVVTPPVAVVTAPVPVVPPKDVPVAEPEPVLVPAPGPPPTPPLVEATPAANAHVGTIVVGGLAGAALVTSAVFLVVAMNEKAGLTANGDPLAGGKKSSLTYPQALAQRDASNLHFTLSAVLGAATLGLGTTAVFLW